MVKSISLFLIVIIIATYISLKHSPKTKLITYEMMTLNSPDFQNNEAIPAKFTCQENNINPTLSINNVPENTKSLVLIVDDPDAVGGTWTHWTLWNINPKIIEIGADSNPGIIGKNDYGHNRYDGPCPPKGNHRYVFHLYALDIILDLEPDTKPDILRQKLIGHIYDQAKLVGTYQKK